MVSQHQLQLPKAKFTKAPLHILLLGDSVDRYAVMDWCRHFNGTLVDERKLYNGLVMDSLLAGHGRRRKHWELRICDAKETR
jgi:hypothetical protein